MPASEAVAINGLLFTSTDETYAEN